LERGDLLIGDALYATYFLLCTLRTLGIDAVFEQYGARQRRTDFRCGQRLGPRDHLIVLHKPTSKPDWMTQAAYDQAPATLRVRELRTGGKTLVTTLLCPKDTHKSALKALFRSRWHVELDLRNLKSTLGMERLSCQTPTMAIKEMWAYLLAYNLLRVMMAQAAFLNDWRPRQLSFKHTLQLWNAWTHHGSGIGHDELPYGLLVLITQQRVGNRVGRIEPRATNDGQNRTRSSSNPVRSPERTSGHMAIPRSLSKCHSGQTLLLRSSREEAPAMQSRTTCQDQPRRAGSVVCPPDRRLRDGRPLSTPVHSSAMHNTRSDPSFIARR
jgi:hypothetical protein